MAPICRLSARLFDNTIGTMIAEDHDGGILFLVRQKIARANGDSWETICSTNVPWTRAAGAAREANGTLWVWDEVAPYKSVVWRLAGTNYT